MAEESSDKTAGGETVQAAEEGEEEGVDVKRTPKKPAVLQKIGGALMARKLKPSPVQFGQPL